MLRGLRFSVLSAVALSGLATAVACSSSGPVDAASEPAASEPAASEAEAASVAATPRWAQAANFIGRAPADEVVSIQVHLRLRAEAEAEAELAAVSDPESPRYRQYLSDEEFDRKYAPDAADVAAVRAHLEAHGLQIGAVPASRIFVPARGTVAQIEKAFGTEIGRYNFQGSARRAPIHAPHLPTRIHGVIRGTLGLTQPLPMKAHRVAVGGLRAVDMANSHPHDTSGPNACSEWYGQALDTTDPAYGGGYPDPLSYAPCGYTPAKLRGAYGIESAVKKGTDGKGVSIAIVDAFLSPTLLQDAQTYAAQNDPDYPLATSQLTTVVAPSTQPTEPQDPGWWTEATLDVEAVHTTAPGAKIVFVSAQTPTDQDLVSAINTVVDKKLATIITNSYGSAEEEGYVDFLLWNATLTQAGLKGIGVYFSSGDYGDNGIPSPDFPASHPSVTAVGGTSLALGPTDQRIFESGWETGVSFLFSQYNPDGGVGPVAWYPGGAGYFYFGSGGGTSEVYAQPSYQVGVVPAALANLPGVAARVVPDVAMLADPVTGFLIGQTQGGVYSEYAIGGTSLASPLFAGVMALAEQNAGKKLGFANPALYKARNKAFTDIVPLATPQAVVIPGGGVVATFDDEAQTLHTAVGYDNVTGLGTPNGQSFLDALK